MTSGQPPRPEDFPVGSPESRAAARALLNAQDRQLRRIQLISHIPRAWVGPEPEPLDWNEVPDFGPWQDCGAVLFRVVYLPGEWLNPGEPIPTCSICGAPFKKGKALGGMTYYAASCWKQRDPDEAH